MLALRDQFATGGYVVDAAQIKSYIHTVPDFPKPGIRFRDITPLLATPRAFKAVIEKMADHLSQYSLDGLTGIEARGFIFGSTLAHTLDLPFYMVRKAGKLPQYNAHIEYDLEYGSDRLEAHMHEIEAGRRIAVVDDVLATGGTADAVCRLMEACGAKVACTSFLMELEGLGGREKLSKYPVESVLNYGIVE